MFFVPYVLWYESTPITFRTCYRPGNPSRNEHNHQIQLKLTDNDMNLKTLITESTSLTIPYALIALTIILGIFGIYLATQLRRKKPKNARARAREAIYDIFSMIAEGGDPRAVDIDILNEELSISFNHLKLRHSENGYRLDLERNGIVLDQLLWPIAQSASDLLVSNKLNRVRRCAAEECGWLFLDTSRNRSRRWCNMKDCGNRMKARRHYKQKRESVSS